MVIAANTMVTIQNRTVIFDSWNTLLGLVNTYVHFGSSCANVVRKWS